MENPSNLKVLERIDKNDISIEILAHENLNGSDDAMVSMKLYFISKTGVKLKQVKITLRKGGITMESGALHYMKGNFNVKSNKKGMKGLAKGMLTKVLTKEKAFKPTYFGTGEIFLEPSFGHFILMDLQNEEAIVDKGMFYCCEPTVDVSVFMQKNFSSIMFGGEGFFQTKLSGSGLCVLFSPVPVTEIMKYKLNNETLQVDGNFALLRKGNIEYSVKKTTRSLIGSIASGEGLLQTFTGTGEVWLAPTESIYEQLKYQSISELADSTGSFGTETKRIKQ